MHRVFPNEGCKSSLTCGTDGDTGENPVRLNPSGRSVRVAREVVALLETVRSRPITPQSVAQPGRAPRLGRGGRVFDSHHSDHGEWRSLVAHALRERGVAGSNPVSPTSLLRLAWPRTGVSQASDAGSNPAGGTMRDREVASHLAHNQEIVRFESGSRSQAP